MNDGKIKRTIKDYIVSWQTLFLISVILFCVDWSLSRPLYTMVLDMPGLGNILACGMATLMAILPKVTAKLLVGKRHGLALLAMLLGIGLMSFLFVGQKEVAAQNAQDPLAGVYMMDAEVAADASQSNTHIVATGLVALLYSIATFIGYLYYADEKRPKPTGYQLSMSKLGREFQYRLLLLKGRFQRAFAKPTQTAEARVIEVMQKLETDLKKYKRELIKLEGRRAYDFQGLANAKARVLAGIRTTFSQKQTVKS